MGGDGRSKNEKREEYKAMGGRKVKGKSGKGGGRDLTSYEN